MTAEVDVRSGRWTSLEGLIRGLARTGVDLAAAIGGEVLRAIELTEGPAPTPTQKGQDGLHRAGRADLGHRPPAQPALPGPQPRPRPGGSGTQVGPDASYAGCGSPTSMRWPERSSLFRRIGSLVVPPTSVLDRLAPRTTRLAIKASVLAEIEATIGSRLAEQGGMLGVSDRGLVETWAPDLQPKGFATIYTPDVDRLNQVRREEWVPAGIELGGFVHSHPAGFTRPSGGDLRYAAAILEARPTIDRLLLPIVQTVPDTGRFEFHPWAAVRTPGGCRLERLTLVVIDGDPKPSPAPALDGAPEAVSEQNADNGDQACSERLLLVTPDDAKGGAR